MGCEGAVPAIDRLRGQRVAKLMALTSSAMTNRAPWGADPC